MSRGRYNYYDPDYNPSVTEGYELLLMLTADTFSFVILQTDTKKVLVWGEDYDHDELQNPIALKSILSAKYNDVKSFFHVVIFSY